MENLESYFRKYRENIVGIDAEFESPFGRKKIIYADWIASGRLYRPIEEKMTDLFGPMVGNTHSEASETGVTMTHIYNRARQIIKEHCDAGQDDVIISEGSGMTGVAIKLQRILGLKISERAQIYCKDDIPTDDRPIVFVTHMEHHSNHTSWLETMADVVVLEPDENLMVSPAALEAELPKYKNRKLKIGAFSAGSNVTGIIPPYYLLAEIMHKHGGYAFVDFAASAPYIDINMHPKKAEQQLDAVYFSPHKALGGPGSTGIVIFNKNLYQNEVPDHPGGGTVSWTNRWNEYQYIDDIETREDGGTPAFLQTIRAALTLKLKEAMGTEKILQREHELAEKVFAELEKIPKLHILANEQRNRIGVFSFYTDDLHHNLMVKLLNDLYGVQVRGGCSCAGTYGHYLLHVDKKTSHRITEKINHGDLEEKPGWTRLSIHPTMTDQELDTILKGIKEIHQNIDRLEKDYYFDKSTGEFFHKNLKRKQPEDFDHWFKL